MFIYSIKGVIISNLSASKKKNTALNKSTPEIVSVATSEMRSSISGQPILLKSISEQ